MPARWSLRTALPGDSATTDVVEARAVHAREQRVEMLLRAAVRTGGEDLDHPDPVGRRQPRRLERRDAPARDARAGAVRAVQASSAVLSSNEDALDWLVDRAPLVLVRLVAAQQVEPIAALGDRLLQELGERARRPATGRARRGRRRRCSTGSRRGRGCRSRPRSVGRRPSGTPAGSGRPARTARTAGGRAPGSGVHPRCRGKSPSVAPPALVQVDERLEVVERVAATRRAGPRRRLGAAELAPDLVAGPSCSASRGSPRMSRPGGTRTTGQTSSRSTLSVQPSAISRAPNAAARASAAGSPQRRRRRSIDVPRGRMRIVAGRRRGEVVGDRIGHGGQVARVGEHGRVVGVVGRAEEDRLRRWRDRSELESGSVAASSCGSARRSSRPRGGA